MGAKPNDHTGELFAPSMKKSLESIAKKEGYISYQLYKRKLDSDSQGYISKRYAVDIKGNTAEGDKETQIFIKEALKTKYMETYMNVDLYFEKESFFYSKLVKILSQMQDDANIPDEDKFNFIKGYEESNAETVFIEDVTEKGFKTSDKADIVSLRFLELSIQQLARFHGLFYVLKKKQPQFFKDKIASQTVNVLKFNDVWDGIATNSCSLSCQDLSDETKKRAQAFIPTAIKKLTAYMGEQTPYSCFCHGDFRLLNIMKKEVNGEITTILPIDYQNSFHGCLFTDFFYFVYGCTDREMRNKHLYYLKDLYYESLDSFLKYFNWTAEEFYPREVFEETFKVKRVLGLIYSLIYYPFLFAPEDKTPDWSKESLASIKYTLAPSIQKRLQDLVDEYIELGIL